MTAASRRGRHPKVRQMDSEAVEFAVTVKGREYTFRLMTNGRLYATGSMAFEPGEEITEDRKFAKSLVQEEIARREAKVMG